MDVSNASCEGRYLPQEVSRMLGDVISAIEYDVQNLEHTQRVNQRHILTDPNGNTVGSVTIKSI
jgi:hypothetical protein